jgi:caffeoyl-CoA O-methyltransferase
VRQGPAGQLAWSHVPPQGYVGYWEEIVPRVTPGGIILVDNTFYGGGGAEPANGDAAVEAIRAFNDHAAGDDRVELVMLPVGDGLTLARKK